ncbi:MAG: hypothetical protein K0R92_1657 [Lachnospiraceae bacterium]|jgi:uncharacterized phage-associated protein|nr:hypothetical protein [Lachnospiraceae bacterium]
MKNDNLQMNSNSVITVSEIKGILKDFRIGKKPLAKLLGWGETTIIRYIEGDIPTVEYSGKLKAIAQDPAYYYELLLKNKDNLTGIAFRKSKQAVLEKLMESKVRLIAQYMINLAHGEIGPAYVQLLLYYAQAFSLGLYEKELFAEDYIVTGADIPYPELFQSMNSHGINVLDLQQDRLKQEEIRLIQNVVNSFTWYGPSALKALLAYERTVLRISRDKENNKIISKETLKSYFKEIIAMYDIHSSEEIYKYPDKKVLDIRNKM